MLVKDLENIQHLLKALSRLVLGENSPVKNFPGRNVRNFDGEIFFRGIFSGHPLDSGRIQ